MTKPNKVCFLDIDGPMIPIRAYYLPHQPQVVCLFDPCAVSLLNNLISRTQAKIVISSNRAHKGLDYIHDLFSMNGLDIKDLHEDWRTPRKLTSYRCNEIGWWLEQHSETEQYVILDDEELDAIQFPSYVKCCTYEGFSFRNYLEALTYLGVADSDEIANLSYLRRKEVWRLQRIGDPNERSTHAYADKLFPINT